MYNATIGKYRFELDTDTNRIMVYREGDGVKTRNFLERINIGNESHIFVCFVLLF